MEGSAPYFKSNFAVSYDLATNKGVFFVTHSVFSNLEPCILLHILDSWLISDPWSANWIIFGNEPAFEA